MIIYVVNKNSITKYATFSQEFEKETTVSKVRIHRIAKNAFVVLLAFVKMSAPMFITRPNTHFCCGMKTVNNLSKR